MASASLHSQDDDQAYSYKKVKITILASEWGSNKGGLSTINRELAIQLAKFPNVEVTFFLPRCSEEDKKEAPKYGVNILEAKRRPGCEELEWLSFPPEHLQIDIIVGNGGKLGHQAQFIRDSHRCKWVQVVHTDPEELGMYKTYENPISKGEQKHSLEVELCEMADFVVAVGPKLTEAFRSYLRPCQKDQHVFDFTPSVFNEFVSAQQVSDETRRRSVLVFGRGDAEDFELKGFDIAAKSVAALPDTQLVFAGAPDGKHEEIAKRLLAFGIPGNRLRVRGYIKSREDLKRLFCEVDLVLMPSRTEGFGLTGLEALSAGVPVLVSRNSGFGEALVKVPFGSSFVVKSEYSDVHMWVAAIDDILKKDRQTRLDEVKFLHDFYEKKYSWSKQSKDLVEKMLSLAFGVSSEFQQIQAETPGRLKKKCIEDLTAYLSIQVDCEAVTGAGARTGQGMAVAAQEPQEVSQGEREIPSTSNRQHAGVTPGELYGGIPAFDPKTVMNVIAITFLRGLDPKTPEEISQFVRYLERVYNVLVHDCEEGSLIITVKATCLQKLEELWEDYCAGHLNEMAEKFLVTEELLEKFGLTEVKLMTFIAEEEYRACQELLSAKTYRGHCSTYIEGIRRRNNLTVFYQEVTRQEKDMIVKAMGLSQGHWFKCPKGHIYYISECGMALEEGRCPECGSTIGGHNNRLRDDNQLAPEMDGARFAAFSDLANIHNFDPKSK